MFELKHFICLLSLSMVLHLVNVGKQRTGNFLFSLRGGSTSLPLKFDGVGITSMASVPVLTYSGIAFGENHEELSLNWTGAPRVISRPGKFFNVTNISLMTGENVFTATDFEVLQPHGNFSPLTYLLAECITVITTITLINTSVGVPYDV